MKKILRFFLLMFCSSAILATAADIKIPSWQPYDKLSGTLVTPYISFANPYYKGKLKTLVIAPTWTQRETVELAQRFSIEYIPLMTHSYPSFGPYKETEDKSYLDLAPREFTKLVDDRLAEDKVYDLIIIGKMPWNSFPEEIQEKILSKVLKGTGLLYINPSELSSNIQSVLTDERAVSDALKMGVPLKGGSLAGINTDILIMSGELGKGRIVSITYSNDKVSKARGKIESLTPFESEDILFYDYYYSLLARACLWAGKRESEVRFKNFPHETQRFARETLEKDILSFEIEGKTTIVKLAEVFIRDSNNKTELQTNLPYRTGDIKVKIPILKSGEKIIDVLLKDKNGSVINWASAPFYVSSEVDIERVEIEKNILKRDEGLTGKLFLTKEPTSDVKITIEARDGFNRKVVEYIPIIESKQANFTLHIDNPLTYAYNLSVRIEDSKGSVAEEKIPFYINITDFSKMVGDYSFIIWGAASDNSRSVRTYLDQFYNSGIDEIYVTSALWDNYEKSREIALRIAKANIKSAPYAVRLFFVSNQHAHLKPQEGADGLEIQNCYLSLPLEKLVDNSIIKHLKDTLAKGYGPLGPSYYSLGDENALSFPYYDVCFCRNCQEGFRKYARDLYKSIDALNSSWNSDYKDWSEVKGITLMNAYKQQRYPQWLDFRMFMDNTFSDFHITCIEALREVDPQAQVGLEGAVYPTRSGTGFNWYRMLPHMGFFGPYRTPIEVHTALSFLPEKALVTAWFGSYLGETLEQNMRFFPWAVLFEGMNSCAWWPSGVGGSSGVGGAAAYTPDFVPLEHFQIAVDEIQEIKSGIGKLLISSNRKLSPIALYYSNACLHASTIRPEETTWERSLYDFHYLLRDARYDYRYLSPDDILDGKLSDVAVLILPYSQAISFNEVDKIKEFVKAGGVLMADFAPGIMDGHGKTLEKSSFADVFGDFKPLEILSYGRGKAIYLGDYSNGYSEKRKRGEGKGVCEGMARFLKELSSGKLVPFAEVRDKNDETRQDVEVSFFENGDAKYLTLIRAISVVSNVKATGPEAGGVSGALALGESSEMVVKIPEKAYIYDIRNKKFLGFTDRWVALLEPSQANLFALMPAKFEKMDLMLDKVEYKRGESVNFTVSLADEFKNSGLCLRVDVYSPEGKRIPYYMQKLMTTGLSAQGVLSLSLDEIKGLYKITVTEISTGKMVSREFKVS